MTQKIIITETSVRGVKIYETRRIIDHDRGNLTVAEFGEELPFVPARYFITYEIPTSATRGEHAHKLCEQFLICTRGSCSVLVDDGIQKQEFHLTSPTIGIYVPPMVWATEYNHSSDSALMVFASHRYDPADYIRKYDEFLDLVKHSSTA
ncbi:MAG: sugar 3,4-ketoisomerase [Verrucomicrobiaceae bacterium]|jgi:dTDP-4-dehydrorhamnose 3,5-epimerase-like enzyme